MKNYNDLLITIILVNEYNIVSSLAVGYDDIFSIPETKNSAPGEL